MKVNEYIDHTVLKANTREEDVVKLCEEAKEYDFKAVCVNPCFVKLAKKELNGTSVNIASVIGFPLGANLTETKVFEAKKAVEDGANEIDMVINISKMLDGDYEFVLNEINQIKEAIGDILLKVIVETAMLSEEEIIKVSDIVADSKAEYFKTSTGFADKGADEKDIKKVRERHPDLLIKASGQIRDFNKTKIMIDAGANRIGTSSSIKIMNGDK